eukprot:s217_g22.t1
MLLPRSLWDIPSSGNVANEKCLFRPKHGLVWQNGKAIRHRRCHLTVAIRYTGIEATPFGLPLTWSRHRRDIFLGETQAGWTLKICPTSASLKLPGFPHFLVHIMVKMNANGLIS